MTHENENENENENTNIKASAKKIINTTANANAAADSVADAEPKGTCTESAAATLVFVIEALTVGGAEQMLVAMANQFSQRGYEVHVICLTQWGVLADELDEKIHRHLLHKKSGVDAKLPRKLRQLIMTIKPDAVNSHLFTANFWTRISLLFTGIRVVVTEHSRDEWKSRLYRTLDRVLIRACHRLVAVSHDTARFYCDEIKLPADKVLVINNGIDTQRYADGDGATLREEWLNAYVPESEQSECVFVGIVGRLVEAKNHTRLLEAAAIWNHKAPNVRTLIIGDGEMAEKIDDGIVQRGLEQRVFRLGNRHDIPNILSALDIFVLSSDREGHPLTALEAQASGTPVVLTNAGGSEDAVAKCGEKIGGYVVEKDTKAFADAVCQVASDQDERLDMSTFAQRYATENFDLVHMVDRYAKTFLQ